MSNSSSALAEKAVSNFPNGVIVVYDEDLRYQLVGPDILPFSQRKASEMRGKSVHELFGDVTGGELGPHLRATLAGEPQSFDVTYDGRIHHVETRPTEIDGESYDVLVTQNVTPERYTTEQLEVLNRIMRHDIRNDIGILLGWAEMLEEHLDEEGRSHLQRILNSGEHILALTNTSRDIIEMLVSGEQMERKPISLRSTLGVELTLRQESFPDAEFTFDEACLEFNVLANELLASVFRNLLNNAVQHNDTDHPIVEVSCEPDDDSIVIRIADNGLGISEAHRETVFDAGRRGLDSSGSGMGLYLVTKLVTGYGGEVWIEGNTPEGTMLRSGSREPAHPRVS